MGCPFSADPTSVTTRSTQRSSVVAHVATRGYPPFKALALLSARHTSIYNPHPSTHRAGALADENQPTNTGRRDRELPTTTGTRGDHIHPAHDSPLPQVDYHLLTPTRQQQLITPALVLSQGVVFTSWSDALLGTIPNVMLRLKTDAWVLD